MCVDKTVLLDHLVGAAKQRDGECEAERLGSFHVDDQFDFRGLLDWQVGRLLTLEDAADIDADLAMSIRNAGAIAHQTASGGKFAIRGVEGWRNPIRGSAGCCARAASGHAAAPPSSEMKSRRTITRSPRRRVVASAEERRGQVPLRS